MPAKTTKTPESLILQELADLKAAVNELRELLSCELYGANGRDGLKQQMAILWDARESGQKMKAVVVGTFLTAATSLLVTVVKWVLGA